MKRDYVVTKEEAINSIIFSKKGAIALGLLVCAGIGFFIISKKRIKDLREKGYLYLTENDEILNNILTASDPDARAYTYDTTYNKKLLQDYLVIANELLFVRTVGEYKAKLIEIDKFCTMHHIEMHYEDEEKESDEDLKKGMSDSDINKAIEEMYDMFMDEDDESETDESLNMADIIPLPDEGENNDNKSITRNDNSSTIQKVQEVNKENIKDNVEEKEPSEALTTYIQLDLDSFENYCRLFKFGNKFERFMKVYTESKLNDLDAYDEYSSDINHINSMEPSEEKGKAIEELLHKAIK